MRVLFMSDNEIQVSLIGRILQAEGVDVVHIPYEEIGAATFLEQDFLAIVLDFPVATENKLRCMKSLQAIVTLKTIWFVWPKTCILTWFVARSFAMAKR
ncbi:hypothetical protein [Effusibacillus pohliae]|uniref:hypothetical protein n=1 Tax=Effusibacillus pohliae TaxID=232270 RepID=UPI00036DDDC5|nr:hypothetical protein [Effusibacillus pohliae]